MTKRKYIIISESEASALSRLKTTRKPSQRQHVYERVKGRFGAASGRAAKRILSSAVHAAR